MPGCRSLIACVGVAGLVIAGCTTPPDKFPKPVARVQKIAPVETAEDLLWKPPAGTAERKWVRIVIHHAAFEGGSLSSIDRLHRVKGWDGVGYHFVIGNGSMTEDGLVEVGFRWTGQLVGAHCRISQTDDNWVNETGIGICLVGNMENHSPSAAQMASLEKLVRYLQNRYHIPLAEVKGHKEFKVTDCPGKYFPWGDFKAALLQDQSVAATPVPPNLIKLTSGR